MNAPRLNANAKVQVKFDDDEDETGTLQEHQINRMHVLPLPKRK
jgi:hypothetical protein